MAARGADGRKGIILAGGSGTRLHPVTRAVSKQLLPVYDKPMIYYPLSTLMLAGIRDILVISTPQDLPRVPAPARRRAAVGAVASATPSSRRPTAWRRPSSSARDFIGGEPGCLVLGDNIFYGHGLSQTLQRAPAARDRAPRSSAITCRIPSATAWSSSTPAGRALSHRGEAGAARARTTP